MIHRQACGKTPGPRGSPGVPGKTCTTIYMPQLNSSASVRTQIGIATLTGRSWLRHTTLRWRGRTPETTRSHKVIGRHIQGGFLQESCMEVWPAAIHPQTPSMPETERPPDFWCCSRAYLKCSPTNRRPVQQRATADDDQRR